MHQSVVPIVHFFHRDNISAYFRVYLFFLFSQLSIGSSRILRLLSLCVPPFDISLHVAHPYTRHIPQLSPVTLFYQRARRSCCVLSRCIPCPTVFDIRDIYFFSRFFTLSLSSVFELATAPPFPTIVQLLASHTTVRKSIIAAAT